MVWADLWHSRMAANTAILAVGLVLQCALAVVVFRRGVARRFPVFAVLLVFYPLRAGLLFALGGRIDADAYSSLFNALTLVEIPLQAAVVVELTLRLVRGLGGWTWRRGAVLLALLGAACGLTWIAVRLVREGRLVDRVQLLAWFVMLLLFGAIAKWGRSRNLLSIAAGFAAFSVIQLTTLAGRDYAMIRHNRGAFIGWSYVPASGYLAVVVFWLVVLRSESAGS